MKSRSFTIYIRDDNGKMDTNAKIYIMQWTIARTPVCGELDLPRCIVDSTPYSEGVDLAFTAEKKWINWSKGCLPQRIRNC